MPYKTVPFDGFCAATYLTPSPVYGSERSINLYPEPTIPGANPKTPAALIGRPGLTNPFITLATSPARGLWTGNNRMFAIGGNVFYEVSSLGTITTNYGIMAGSSGAGPSTIRANGVQLLVLDLSAASIYNALTAGPSMTKVFNASALEYLDGFYVAIATGASLAGSNPNQMNVSNLLDGSTWQPLNYVIRTTAADLIWQLAVLNRMLVVFGQKTTSFWYNAGNPTFPFSEFQGGTAKIGCLAPFSVATFSDTCCWLGGDETGYAQVYMLNGMSPRRISNPSIEFLISQYGQANNLTKAWAYGYTEAGHTFYCLKIVNNSYVPVAELVYDMTNGLWHERIYAGAWPVALATLPPTIFTGPVGANYVGDGLTGNIHVQNIFAASDNGTSITYTRQTPHAGALNKWVRYPFFELDASIGTAAAKLSVTNDGARSGVFYDRETITASNDQGVSNGFGRFVWRNLGRSRDRVFKVSITSSVETIRLQSAYLGVDVGAEQ